MLDEDAIRREVNPLGWARDKLTERDPVMVASKNLDIAYEPEYLEAAAIVFDEQPAEFDRLLAKLKGRGIRLGDFKRKVEEAHRELKAAEKARTKAAAAAAAPIAAGPNGRESQATQLVKLAQDHATFFHDGDDCYARVTVGGHQELHGLKARGFRRWLSHTFNVTTQTVCGADAISTAITALSGYAFFECAEERTFTRVGARDGRLYLDLRNDQWEVVEIDRYGWRIRAAADCPPLRRANGMLPLPVPERGGSINELRPFLNVENDDDFILVMAWLVAALRDQGPFPILHLYGEPGAAKTSAGKVLRRSIDPNVGPLRLNPREPRDLMIAARNGWVIATDNVSKIPQWLSDTMCVLATGGAFGTRELYSDNEEVLFSEQRPQLLTSIAEVITAGDALDRVVLVTLPEIKKVNRRVESRFWADFAAASPRILGALLAGVATALARIDCVALPELPRMADFALWVEAAAPSFGWEPGQFLRVYSANRATANDLPLQNLVCEQLVKLPLPWRGTASALLKALELIHDGEDNQGKRIFRGDDWPANARVLSAALRMIVPNLRNIGIHVQFPRRSGRARSIYIYAVPPPTEENSASSASSASQTQQNQSDFSDAGYKNGASHASTPASHPDSDATKDDAEFPASHPASQENLNEYAANDASDAEMHPIMPNDEKEKEENAYIDRLAEADRDDGDNQ
jgi:hypothetical protein